MSRLNSKAALITGGARGIGAAIARAFVAEGAVVVVSDILNQLGASLAAELGPRATYLELDVRVESHWDRVAGHLRSNPLRFGNPAQRKGRQAPAPGVVPLRRATASRRIRT